ncbi:hypothetical protein LT493_41415 [Streptomyces tricolor]|nr:hypothetical protein [Streptomyces tricolor]
MTNSRAEIVPSLSASVCSRSSSQSRLPRSVTRRQCWLPGAAPARITIPCTSWSRSTCAIVPSPSVSSRRNSLWKWSRSA